MPLDLAVAEIESVVMISIYKPVLFIVVAMVWAKIVAALDKDMMRHFFRRRAWNGLQIAAGAMGFFIWLMIIWFWLGLLLAMVIFSAAIGGYIMYRNGKVPPGAQWKLTMDLIQGRIDNFRSSSAEVHASVHLMSNKGEALAVPTANTSEGQSHALLEQLMEFSLPRHADRIEVVVEAEKTTVNVRVDGVQYAQPVLEPQRAVALTDYLKQSAGLDPAERRRKQRGGVMLVAGELGNHQLSIASSGSTHSLTTIVDIDRREAVLMPLDNLGLLDSQRQQLEPLLKTTSHVIIVACPSQQGMTSTINSLVNRHDPYTQSIISLDEEIELELEGVTHEVIDPGADADTVARRLSAILRSDPAVILLNRLSDDSHAQIIADAAKETRFYLGLRQDYTFAALRVWLKTVGQDQLAAESLGAIITQRLVRKLCNSCRIAYTPDPAVLKKLNLPIDRVPQLFKHSGQVQIAKNRTERCNVCMGMGYQGRIGVFEIMVLDDEARQVLATSQLDQFRALVRRKKMLYLQESALLKVVEGLTSVSEVTRALGATR